MHGSLITLWSESDHINGLFTPKGDVKAHNYVHTDSHANVKHFPGYQVCSANAIDQGQVPGYD